MFNEKQGQLVIFKSHVIVIGFTHLKCIYWLYVDDRNNIVDD